MADNDDDEISLDNLEDLIGEDATDSEDAEGDAPAAETKGEEPEPEKEEVPAVPFKELSGVGKAKWIVLFIVGIPVRIVNEILYFIGGIEHRVKSAANWLVSDGVPGLIQRIRSLGIPAALIKRLPKMPDLSGLKKWNWREHKGKLALAGLGIVLIFAASKLFQAYKEVMGGQPFLPSFETVADEVFRFDEERFESFYSSPRFAGFSMSLPQMKVNLAEEKKGRTSVAAFKFSLEVSSQATLDEVEEKKARVVDLMQRSISEWRYSDLSTAAGKKKMREKVIEEVNGALSTGRIKHLYIETVILNP